MNEMNIPSGFNSANLSVTKLKQEIEQLREVLSSLILWMASAANSPISQEYASALLRKMEEKPIVTTPPSVTNTCTCTVITGGHLVPTSAGCPVHGRG